MAPLPSALVLTILNAVPAHPVTQADTIPGWDRPIGQIVESFDPILPHARLRSKLFHLDLHQDGIAQMTAELANHHGIQTLHFICNDPQGSLKLGSTHLTLFNLDRYGWQLQQWGEALAPRAQIIFHRGPQTIGPEISSLLITRLALLTGSFVIVKDHAISSSIGPSVGQSVG